MVGALHTGGWWEGGGGAGYSMKKRLFGKKRVLLCCVIAAACLCAGCGSGKKGSTQKTDAGYAAMETSDYRGAESAFREAVSQGEDALQAYRGLGIALMGDCVQPPPRIALRFLRIDAASVFVSPNLC